MTMPCERTRAVQYARDFLLELLDPKKTPRVPLAVRKQAGRVLRHFPHDLNLEQAAKGAPNDFGKPEPTVAQLERDREFNKIRDRIRKRLRKK